MSESEHEKNKPGLHKEISSIFKGVPIPQNGDAEQSCEPSTPERTVRAVREPLLREPEPPLREPEPPTVEPQSIPGPKALQLEESSHEVSSSQQPEADIAESSSEVAPSQQPEADIAASSAEAGQPSEPSSLGAPGGLRCTTTSGSLSPHHPFEQAFLWTSSIISLIVTI